MDKLYPEYNCERCGQRFSTVQSGYKLLITKIFGFARIFGLCPKCAASWKE